MKTEHNFGKNFPFFQCHCYNFENSATSSDHSVFLYRIIIVSVFPPTLNTSFIQFPPLNLAIARQQGRRHKSCPSRAGCISVLLFLWENYVSMVWTKDFFQEKYLPHQICRYCIIRGNYLNKRGILTLPLWEKFWF